MPAESFPTVSVIVPCLNESKRIRLLLDAIAAQTYPLEKLDITIADGGSTDNTREVVTNFASSKPLLQIKIIENPSVTIPSALNRAIQSSTGEVILRLDAHSAPMPDYITLSVEALVQGKGDNVGGIWIIKQSKSDWISRAISVAAANPIGVGNARYRYTDHAGYVDTVPFGCFYRRLIDRIGMFDETLLTNEDYEFNTRVRNAGGKIWLDPAIQCVYYSRDSLTKLIKQYYRYGFWKYKMLKRYPKTILWRQALPPLFLLSLIFGSLISLVYAPFFIMVELELLVYLLCIVAAGIYEAVRKKDAALITGFPLAVVSMHFSWGAGFLVSIFLK